MKSLWLRFVNETQGQDLIEYALLAATIALGTIAGMQAVRDAVNTEFSSIGSSITGAS
jgi:Flp pilus assembly pilin Flp